MYCIRINYIDKITLDIIIHIVDGCQWMFQKLCVQFVPMLTSVRIVSFNDIYTNSQQIQRNHNKQH